MADRGLVSFPGGRPGAGYLLLRGQKKLTEEKAAPASRACAFPVLLDKFGVCGTRSKNEKTHKGCELRQVLADNPFHVCAARRLTKGLKASSVAMRAMV